MNMAACEPGHPAAGVPPTIGVKMSLVEDLARDMAQVREGVAGLLKAETLRAEWDAWARRRDEKWEERLDKNEADVRDIYTTVRFLKWLFVALASVASVAIGLVALYK